MHSDLPIRYTAIRNISEKTNIRITRTYAKSLVQNKLVNIKVGKNIPVSPRDALESMPCEEY